VKGVETDRAAFKQAFANFLVGPRWLGQGALHKVQALK
jgi:hypothetical protein